MWRLGGLTARPARPARPLQPDPRRRRDLPRGGAVALAVRFLAVRAPARCSVPVPAASACSSCSAPATRSTSSWLAGPAAVGGNARHRCRQ
ncbi:hypothetical protein HBB16_08015 [Pseudonocardia sp. MCCB 268]|nr:hypothetical protein [Pseudonocardia cytotoxica]